MTMIDRLDHLSARQTAIWIITCCFLLFLLWLPGLEYPLWADTAYYVLLGKNIWTEGVYALNGIPHAKFLPLHALYAYPFAAMFGYSLGMKIATLVAGWGVMITSFLLLKETVSRKVGLIVVALLPLQPGFLLMSMFGGSDLLFTTLILASALCFVKAEKRQTMYLWAGLLLGAACLTRYNGVPMFGVYALWMLWKRPKQLLQPWSWTGFLAGFVLLSMWFLRNYLIFGNPLHTDYTMQPDAGSPSLIAQFIRSIVYYGNPLHSVLPVLLFFAMWGIVRLGKKQMLLVLIMLGGWALAFVWWSKGIRYLVPTLPILLGFAALGFTDIYNRIRRKNRILWVTLILLLLTHLPMLCVYSYGSCNALLDNSIGILSPLLNLTQEGMHAWNEGKDYVNAHAITGARISTDLDEAEIAVLEQTFRADLHITKHGAVSCADYRLTQSKEFTGSVVFMSESQPVTRVMKTECAMPSPSPL